MRNRSLILLLLFWLAAPVMAESPIDVVKTVYAGWDAIRPCTSVTERDFFLRNKRYFDSAFLADLDKGYGYGDHMWPGSDLLFGGQVNCYGYSVQSEVQEGSKATVDVFVRLGLDRQRSQVNGYRVHLVESPEGWRIADLDYGDRTLHETVRAYLEWMEKQD